MCYKGFAASKHSASLLLQMPLVLEIQVGEM